MAKQKTKNMNPSKNSQSETPSITIRVTKATYDAINEILRQFREMEVNWNSLHRSIRPMSQANLLRHLLILGIGTYRNESGEIDVESKYYQE